MEESSFVTALKNESLPALQRIPKSDLHSHAGRGGHISYVEKYANVKITPNQRPFESLFEMNQWLKDNVKCHLPQGAEELGLDQIQHGVLAAKSEKIMRYLADNQIQLNVCPTSNVMLKVSADYKTHPIHTLFANGVKVTINTDDLLIFNSTLSEEYLKLYKAGMKASDLEVIRQTGLHYS